MVKQSGHALLFSSSRNQLIRSSSKGSGGVNNLKTAIKACLALAITIWMIYQLKFSLNHDSPGAAVVGDDIDNTKIQIKTRMTTQTGTKEETMKLGRKGMILTGGEMGSSGKRSSGSKTVVENDDHKSETENKGLVEEEEEQEEQIEELVDGVDKDGNNDDDEEEEDEGDDEEDELEMELLDDTTEDENTNSQSSIENDLSD